MAPGRCCCGSKLIAERLLLDRMLSVLAVPPVLDSRTRCSPASSRVTLAVTPALAALMVSRSPVTVASALSVMNAGGRVPTLMASESPARNRWPLAKPPERIFWASARVESSALMSALMASAPVLTSPPLPVALPLLLTAAFWALNLVAVSPASALW